MRRVAVAIFLSLMTASQLALAHDDPRIVVRVVSRGPAAEVVRIVSAIRAQVGDAATIITGETEATVGYVVDIDRATSGIVVRISDGRGRPLGLPRTVANDGELGASEVASIVGAFITMAGDATDAAAARESPPPSPIEATAPAVITRAPEPTGLDAHAAEGGASRVDVRHRDERRVRASLLYAGTTYGSSLPWHNGIRGEISLRFASGIYGGLGYALHPAARVENETVTARLSRHAGGAFVGVESQGRRFVVGADAAIGFDLANRTTERTSAGIEATSGSSNVSPCFALRAHLRWRLAEGNGLAVDIAPALEIAPGGRTLAIADAGGAQTPLLTPAVGRFRLDAGFSFDGF